MVEEKGVEEAEAVWLLHHLHPEDLKIENVTLAREDRNKSTSY